MSLTIPDLSMSDLPDGTGHAGEFLTTDGVNVSWAYAGIASVTTATTATTLTSTPTLLKITPASYGVTVTLPDATTCSVGGPLHIIDNRGAYPVRVEDSTGTLKAFVFAGVVSHISLDDNSTAAGVWAVENGELVGASAQLLTESIKNVFSCIAIDSNREFLLGYGGGSSHIHGVVYDKSTNTFGSPTLIRSVSGGYETAVLSGTDQILVASVSGTSTTLFEAVTLSISGTTITVNTAATATLSANFGGFADGCGLIAVGSSFVTSYTVATPAAQIRALSISGTTVTIGSATVLAGAQAASTNGLIVASGSVVIAASYQTGTTAVTVAPYTVSGATLTLGTAATTGTAASNSIQKFFALGTRWCLIHRPSAADTYGAIVTLTGTVVTISTVAFGGGISVLADAIVVGSNKVLMLGTDSSGNANILTDTAGTASAGTAITLSSQTTRACLYASGTDVAVQEGTTTYLVQMVDCSGASPVLTKTIATAGNVSYLSGGQFLVSNAVLSRSASACYGTAFAQVNENRIAEQRGLARVHNGVFSIANMERITFAGDNAYRGKADSERWIIDGATVITKVECVA